MVRGARGPPRGGGWLGPISGEGCSVRAPVHVGSSEAGLVGRRRGSAECGSQRRAPGGAGWGRKVRAQGAHAVVVARVQRAAHGTATRQDHAARSGGGEVGGGEVGGDVGIGEVGGEAGNGEIGGEVGGEDEG
eukprot:4103316-Prymnesium_polylepis.1